MNGGTWITIISIATGIVTLYTGYEVWRKRQVSKSLDVVTSAIQLLQPYREEVEKVRTELVRASATIEEMTNRLHKAEVRAEELSKELDYARSEVNFLRVQVDMLKNNVKEDI